MPFARLAPTVRLATAATLFATLTLGCWGQEPSAMPVAPTPQNTPEARPAPALDYGKPASHFPNPIGPYTARHIGPPNLANTARIDQLMHDGKLYLSLNDAIALALENNLDIAIARYNLNIADTDLLRARAGAHRSSVFRLALCTNTARWWRWRHRWAGRFRHGRHYAWRGRRRCRRCRSYQFHAWIGTDHQQLRSRPHRDPARRSFQPASH